MRDQDRYLPVCPYCGHWMVPVVAISRGHERGYQCRECGHVWPVPLLRWFRSVLSIRSTDFLRDYPPRKLRALAWFRLPGRGRA